WGRRATARRGDEFGPRGDGGYPKWNERWPFGHRSFHLVTVGGGYEVTALRRALGFTLDRRRRHRGHAEEDRARLGGAGVRRRGAPARATRSLRGHGHTSRRRVTVGRRRGTTDVRRRTGEVQLVVGEVRFLRRRQVPQVGLHRRQI